MIDGYKVGYWCEVQDAMFLDEPIAPNWDAIDETGSEMQRWNEYCMKVMMAYLDYDLDPEAGGILDFLIKKAGSGGGSSGSGNNSGSGNTGGEDEDDGVRDGDGGDDTENGQNGKSGPGPGISDKEKKWIKDNLPYSLQLLGSSAFAYAAMYIGVLNGDLDYSHQGNGDEADAFRHVYWSALKSFTMGLDKAKEFGELHENYPGNDPLLEAMDYHNNNIGYNIGLRAVSNLGNDGFAVSFANLLQWSYEAVRSGTCIIVYPPR
jgi:hypothetical protein